jgi:hypothetical protein
MHSESTTVASLPDKVTMPCSRLRTLTCSPGDRNMVDPAAGPCQRCQVSGRTVHILSGLSSPRLMRSKATWTAIILAIDAGGIVTSAFFA